MKGRSSLSRTLFAATAVDWAVAATVAVAGVTPATLSVVVNTVAAVASSLIVAVPVTDGPPVIAAVSVIVSLLSMIASSMSFTRTNKLAVSARVASPSAGI